MASQQRSTRRWRRIAGASLLMLLLPLTGSAQSSLASQFDHFTTGFRLDGAHQFATCGSCHVDAIFTGTPIFCAGCHTQASRVQASTQPAQHVLSSERCDACHQTDTWVPVVRVDHLEVFGTCASCHDGRIAMGKPFDHFPANEQCDSCHWTTAFAPALFDHVGIVSNCVSCHDGIQAMGKPFNHIPATNVCEDCHNTISFGP